MAIPKILDQMRHALQDNKNNTITDGNLTFSQSDNNKSNFTIDLKGHSGSLYSVFIGTSTSVQTVAYQGSRTITYATSVTVSSTGTLSLVNPTTIEITATGSDLDSSTKTLLTKKYFTNLRDNSSKIYYSDVAPVGRTMGDGAYTVELQQAKEVSVTASTDNTINVDLTSTSNAKIRLSGLQDPVNEDDAVNKNYVDSSGSLPFILINSTDGVTYTGTSSGIKEYKVGMLMIVLPNIANTAQSKISNITVNINNLGVMRLAQYTVKKRGVSNALGMWSVGMAVEAGFLYANEPFVAQIQQDSNGYILLPTARGLYLEEFANGTFGANLSVSSSNSESGILRNIFVSSGRPESTDGAVGDVWIQYEE